MALSLTTENTVFGRLAPKSGTARLATNVVTVILGTVLMALCTKISVLQVPVPITLGTFAIAALSAAFGWRIGVATMALYIAEGLAGLPVFAYGGGPAYIFSPSFGFILGFLPMAYIIGRGADAGLSGKPVKLFGLMVLGDAVAFLFGFAWLLAAASLISSSGGVLPTWLDASNLLATAFAGAVKPFIVWDIVKMAFAAVSVAGVFTLLRRKA